jgi:hypothetical protein
MMKGGLNLQSPTLANSAYFYFQLRSVQFMGNRRILNTVDEFRRLHHILGNEPSVCREIVRHNPGELKKKETHWANHFPLLEAAPRPRWGISPSQRAV